MNEPWKEVLLDYREDVLNYADHENVLLNRITDFLLSKRCIQQNQVELLTKSDLLSRNKMGKLLDFILSENSFNELCNALEVFGTEDMEKLTKSLREALERAKQSQQLKVESEVQMLRNQLIELKREKDDAQQERDEWKREYEIKQEELERNNNEKRQLEKDISKRIDHARVAKLERDRDQMKREWDELRRKIDARLEEELERVEIREREKICETKLANWTLAVNEVIREKQVIPGDPALVEVKLMSSTIDGSPIDGLTTLDDEMFVFRCHDTEIAVYDLMTFVFRRSIQVPDLHSVIDMTSCKRYRCIYISDDQGKLVHRVDTKNTTKKWSVKDAPQGLSVNSVYNVLVTFNGEGKVTEFKTDGQVVREISLDPSIVHPFHAVELPTGQLVICHGGRDDPAHRVCIVDPSGRALHSYGGSKGSARGLLNCPWRLSVNADGVIFIADLNNGRVLASNQTLRRTCEVVSGLRFPSQMLLDDRTGRLCVADNDVKKDKIVSGQIKMYSVQLT